MAGFMTDKGAYKWHDYVVGAATLPTNFYVALIRSTSVPDADTQTLGELTQIAGGTGYTTNGYELTPGATDFDGISEEAGYGKFQIKDVTWTASGDDLDATGNGARYAVMTDDNVTPASRLVLFGWDLGADRNVSDGQTLTLQNLEGRISQPA